MGNLMGIVSPLAGTKIAGNAILKTKVNLKELSF